MTITEKVSKEEFLKEIDEKIKDDGYIAVGFGWTNLKIAITKPENFKAVARLGFIPFAAVEIYFYYARNDKDGFLKAIEQKRRALNAH